MRRKCHRYRTTTVIHLIDLMGSICQNHGKYATAGTPRKFWAAWKEEHADDLDVRIAKLVNTPLTAEQRARLRNRSLKVIA